MTEQREVLERIKRLHPNTQELEERLNGLVDKLQNGVILDIVDSLEQFPRKETSHGFLREKTEFIHAQASSICNELLNGLPSVSMMKEAKSRKVAEALEALCDFLAD